MDELRVWSRMTSHFKPPIHPVCRRFSSVEYCRYAPSSRLAGAVRGVDLDAHKNANLFLTGPSGAAAEW